MIYLVLSFLKINLTQINSAVLNTLRAPGPTIIINPEPPTLSYQNQSHPKTFCHVNGTQSL